MPIITDEKREAMRAARIALDIKISDCCGKQFDAMWKLSPEERETHINFNEAGNAIVLFTDSPRVARRLIARGKMPEILNVEAGDGLIFVLKPGELLPKWLTR